MRISQAIELKSGERMNRLKSARADRSAPTQGSLSRQRRCLVYIVASALLLVSILALAWNGQAKSVPAFNVNQYGHAPESRGLEPLGFQKADGPGCRAIGEPCFLGIDPDVYQMPLFGEYIQSGDHLICATRNWSSYPPEAFNIDFMRAFWPQTPPQDQAATEGAAFFLVTTHWGPGRHEFRLCFTSVPAGKIEVGVKRLAEAVNAAYSDPSHRQNSFVPLV